MIAAAEGVQAASSDLHADFRKRQQNTLVVTQTADILLTHAPLLEKVFLEYCEMSLAARAMLEEKSSVSFYFCFGFFGL
jgi:hypothetical protein